MLNFVKYFTFSLFLIPSMSSLAFSTQCEIITNAYTSTQNTVVAKENTLEKNAIIMQGIFQQAADKSISKEDFNALLGNLLTCLKSSAILGSTDAEYGLAINLIAVNDPQSQKDALFARILANTKGDSNLIFALKIEFFRNLVDQNILQSFFQDKKDQDINPLFASETMPSTIKNIEDIVEAYEGVTEDLPSIALYLLENSQKGSPEEMLGIVGLQEYSANTLQSLETNLDHYILISDFLMDHLQYRSSYEFTQKTYDYAKQHGNESQKKHAENQLSSLYLHTNTQN